MYTFCQVCDDCGCMLCDGEYERLEMESVYDECDEEVDNE